MINSVYSSFEQRKFIHYNLLLEVIYINYYNEIKQELINNEIHRKVKEYSINRNDLETYYNVGKLLFNAGKQYGEKIIEEYSKKLVIEVDKKYSKRTLFRIKQFYLLFQNEKVSTLSTQLTWSHYSEVLHINDNKQINYYLYIAKKYNLSIRKLRERIKSNEYERLPEKTKQELINKNDSKIEDYIKNPILIHNRNNYEIISEKILQKMILEDIESFMNELGSYYSFIASEYKLKIGNTYNYIDLLLFNIKFNCYVVIELKITELKKEHIGQISTYMNYIDKEVKDITHDKTIGIIIVKKDNCFIMEYCSDPRIIKTTYRIN